MGLDVRLCVCVLFTSVIVDGALSRNEVNQRQQNHHRFTNSRDWDTDWKSWALSHGLRHGDPVPGYDYTKTLSTRQLSHTPQETDTMWVTRQRGSAVIPHRGATVRISPHKEHPQMLYKNIERATVRPQKKRRRKNHLRHNSLKRNHQMMHDQPPGSRFAIKPCVRCPDDQDLLAPKGSNYTVMDTPLIIPCDPWSSVHKVKSEVLVGPHPGTKMEEGIHKMVLHLFRHKRTLATCVIRYNVRVRKCSDLKLGERVKADCTMGNAWGSTCKLSCDPGYVIEGDSSTECSDDLEWTGFQPQCILGTGCLVPVTPEHGHLSCRTPQHQPVSLQDTSILPDGTVCHFRCQPGYEVPPEQSHLTRMRCIAGSWDSVQDPVCVEENIILEEDELQTDTPLDEVLSLDGKDCPEDFCANGGMCLTILEEPMCSCQPGYSGPQCELGESDWESNTETDKE